jgi:hypothetical protein
MKVEKRVVEDGAGDPGVFVIERDEGFQAVR